MVKLLLVLNLEPFLPKTEIHTAVSFYKKDHVTICALLFYVSFPKHLIPRDLLVSLILFSVPLPAIFKSNSLILHIGQYKINCCTYLVFCKERRALSVVGWKICDCNQLLCRFFHQSFIALFESHSRPLVLRKKDPVDSKS